MRMPDMNLFAASKLHPDVHLEGRPGMVVGVLANGRVASWQARGRTELGTDGTPLTSGTIFYVASVAKQFTAACIAICERSGSIRIASSIRHYLPELPACFDRVTVEHLLSHIGGVPAADPLASARGLSKNWWDGRGLWDLIGVLCDAQALAAAPGEAYRYSNEGYWLLAGAIERANGQTFARCAQEQLFEPLGMAHSRFRDDPDSPQPGLATGHAVGGDKLIPVRTRFHGVGDGGLLTSLSDLAKWDLFWSGRSPLGATIPARLTAQGRLNDGSKLQYAWGVSIRKHRGFPIIGHGGNYIGYQAKFVRFPEQDFSVACVANADDIDVDKAGIALADAVLGGNADLSAPSWAQTLSADGRAGD